MAKSNTTNTQKNKVTNKTETINKTESNKKTNQIIDVIVEDVSDNDSEDESEDESDNDSDSVNESVIESDNDSDNNDDEANKGLKDKKEKPKKLSHKELTFELLSNEEKISKLETDISEFEIKLKGCVRDQNALRRINLRLIKQLDKAHDDDVNKARKEKKKRNVTEDSGILKKKPVPPVLIKFLDLIEGDELPRTKVMSLLCNKFKELGLRQGQDIILDKKTSKIFGKDEGYVIEFKFFQKFLKSIYEESGLKSTEVIL